MDVRARLKQLIELAEDASTEFFNGYIANELRKVVDELPEHPSVGQGSYSPDVHELRFVIRDLDRRVKELEDVTRCGCGWHLRKDCPLELAEHTEKR